MLLSVLNRSWGLEWALGLVGESSTAWGRANNYRKLTVWSWSLVRSSGLELSSCLTSLLILTCGWKPIKIKAHPWVETRHQFRLLFYNMQTAYFCRLEISPFCYSLFWLYWLPQLDIWAKFLCVAETWRPMWRNAGLIQAGIWTLTEQQSCFTIHGKWEESCAVWGCGNHGRYKAKI